LANDSDSSLVNAMMFRKEPKAGPDGTLSWSVSVKNPATGDDFELFVKELDLPDGSHRPYSVWMAGEFPAAYNGLCKLLSFDMRIIDPAWIGMKLRKLRTYKEPQGDFLAQVPGSVSRPHIHRLLPTSQISFFTGTSVSASLLRTGVL
jgi:ribonucleoside-diphosphate reductase alpha chain